MKRIAVIFVLLATVFIFAGSAAAYQSFKGPLGVLQDNPGVTDGYVLIAPQNSKITYLIDNKGNIVKEWKSEYPCFYAEMLPNGNMARHSRNMAWGPNFGGAGGLIEEFDWDGNIVFSYTMYIENKEILHHTFEVMPNGNYLLLGWEYKSYEEAVAKGLDTKDEKRALYPEGVPFGGKKKLQGIWPDFVREIDHDGKTVWEWHVWDHVGTGPDQFDINKYCAPVYGMPFLAGPDWTHFNGISYNPKTDEIAMTSRNLAEVYIIDKKTGKLTYRWGNPANYGAGRAPGGYGDDGDQKLFGPHAPDWTEEGTITILDNGTARPSGTYNKALELNPKTDEVVWEWTPEKLGVRFAAATNFYSPFQCGVQKIGNGNYLITSTSFGHVIEVGPDNQIVWEFLSPVYEDKIFKASNSAGVGGGGIHRAMRYKPNWPGFRGKVIKPVGKMPNWTMQLNDNAYPNPAKKK